MRSRKLWEMLAESIHDQGLNPAEVMGWKKRGTLALPLFKFFSSLCIYIFLFFLVCYVDDHRILYFFMS